MIDDATASKMRDSGPVSDLDPIAQPALHYQKNPRQEQAVT
ncbi:MAG: hypothetical protein R8G34_06195 [Paracoccaceae bacterium]|nr:hypothetical protein [Paracoccaceae bacterium]